MSVNHEEEAKKMSPEQINAMLLFVKERDGKKLSPHLQIIYDNTVKILDFYFAQYNELLRTKGETNG